MEENTFSRGQWAGIEREKKKLIQALDTQWAFSTIKRRKNKWTGEENADTTPELSASSADEAQSDGDSTLNSLHATVDLKQLFVRFVQQKNVLYGQIKLACKCADYRSHDLEQFNLISAALGLKD